jgi:hypothetical protein
MASVDRRPSGSWQARYRPQPGATQITKTFERKAAAQRWVREQTAAVVTGTHIDPRRSVTVGE